MAIIQGAWYGFHQQVRECTQKIKELYQGGQSSFGASNNYCGDPSPGNTKTLVIIWHDDDNAFCGMTSEGDKTPITIE